MSKITMKIQQFFDALITKGLVNKKNVDQLPQLWSEIHVGRPCPALVIKSKDESRIGQACGRPCMKDEETCLCHLPKEKRDVFADKAKQSRKDNTERKKQEQLDHPEEVKSKKEKKVKEPKEKKVKEPKENKVKKVKEPKEPNAPKKQKKVKNVEEVKDVESDEEKVSQQLEYDSVVGEVQDETDQLEQLELQPVAIETVSAAVEATTVVYDETVTEVAQPLTCTAVLKSGIHSGEMCGKKVQQGMTLCLKHNK